MFRAVQDHFNKFNVLVMTAAVSDYRPKILYSKKMKKGKRIKNLKLIPNPDILSWASRHKKAHLLVGFAAETDQVLANARKKLIKKKLDMIIANRVGEKNAGFGSDKIEFSIVDSRDSSQPFAIWNKEKLAREIVRNILMKMNISK
jgi:phosphopantothenoylcysteine decarboxylase/phosphopantothenate--cysteine ligase